MMGESNEQDTFDSFNDEYNIRRLSDLEHHKKDSTIIYLATPYSHIDNTIKWIRYIMITQFTAYLINKGLIVFSPITMCHPIATHYSLPGDWEFWQRFDSQFLEVCSDMIILAQEGWNKSVGLKNELKIAKSLNKPVDFVFPDSPLWKECFDA